jgi:hypothetical protein
MLLFIDCDNFGQSATAVLGFGVTCALVNAGGRLHRNYIAYTCCSFCVEANVSLHFGSTWKGHEHYRDFLYFLEEYCEAHPSICQQVCYNSYCTLEQSNLLSRKVTSYARWYRPKRLQN